MHRVFRESGADRFWLNGLYPVRPMPTMDDSEIAEMLRLYEEVLSQDYFERLERFSFWERSIAGRIDESTRRVFARAPLSRRAAIKVKRAFDLSDRRSRRAQELHEFCLVGWYGTTLNANGDAVTCCILQDHPTAVMGSVTRARSARSGRAPRTNASAPSCARSWRAAATPPTSRGPAPWRACAPKRARARCARTTGRTTPRSAGASTRSSRECARRRASRSRR
jgi:hypothetical protein